MFQEKDIGKRVTYSPEFGEKKCWKLKSYNNEKRVAFVVYNCNDNRDADHWKDYTAQGTSYDDIEGYDFSS